MEYFGLTDKGRVRPTNQDIFQIEAREDNRTALLVVCDGMGGANAGNVASRFAAQSFIESAGDALSGTLDETARQNLLTQALKQANETVFSLAGRQPEFRGMGTTLVAALIQGDCATVINVGDSRAYRFDGEAMHQISEDHSYVEEMRRRGKITEADAHSLYDLGVEIQLTLGQADRGRADCTANLQCQMTCTAAHNLYNRAALVGTFPDGNSALMLVCTRLRHVEGTQWGSKKYMNTKHLETALDDAFIAG